MDEVMAYVDGELDGAARAAFEQRLGADAVLRSRVEREQRLRAMLGATYAPVVDEAVPPRITAVLRPKVVSLDSRRRWTPTWVQLGGMAASVMLGLIIGHQMRPAGGGLNAQGELAQALDGKLSGEGVGSVRLGLSFAAKDGRYCRTFATDGSAGLACREDEGWRVRQLMPAAPAAAGEYRTAASGLPPALLAAVDEMREGEVLDAAGERAAKSRGWKR